MKTPPKSFWIILIALVLIIVVVQIILPDKDTTTDANLIVTLDTDVPVGSVYISYPRWDGSSVTEGCTNADNSLMKRGDTLYFDGVNWPTTITVCSDLQGSEMLAQFVIEAEPPEGSVWYATLFDGRSGLDISIEEQAKETR